MPTVGGSRDIWIQIVPHFSCSVSLAFPEDFLLATLLLQAHMEGTPAGASRRLHRTDEQMLKYVSEH
jgi:hypothetical protein